MVVVAGTREHGGNVPKASGLVEAYLAAAASA